MPTLPVIPEDAVTLPAEPVKKPRGRPRNKTVPVTIVRGPVTVTF